MQPSVAVQTDIPWPITAGVFGIARHTERVGSSSRNMSMGQPAAMLTTSADLGTACEMSLRTDCICCGLTATSTRSAFSMHDVALACV